MWPQYQHYSEHMHIIKSTVLTVKAPDWVQRTLSMSTTDYQELWDRGDVLSNGAYFTSHHNADDGWHATLTILQMAKSCARTHKTDPAENSDRPRVAPEPARTNLFCLQFLQSYTVLEPDIINVRVHTDACRTKGLAVGDNAKRAAAVGQICCEWECPAERKHSGSWVKKHQSAKH